MEVELSSVILKEIQETNSIVEVTYKTTGQLEGIELMGVDAGLSWLKNESLAMKRDSASMEGQIYSCKLTIATSCEFRARGFLDQEDHWEEGLGNHKIVRHDDGQIAFETTLDKDLYYFMGERPLDYSFSDDKMNDEVINLFDIKPSLLQLLLYLPKWINSVFLDPIDEEKVNHFSKLMKYFKMNVRERNSQKLDDLTRPIIKALFHMYVSALEFSGEDPKSLTEEWIQAGYRDLFDELQYQIKDVEYFRFGHGKDAADRWLNLLTYA